MKSPSEVAAFNVTDETVRMTVLESQSRANMSAAPAAPQLQDWKLVPVEPDERMLLKAQIKLSSGNKLDWLPSSEDLVTIYTAMLAVSPTAAAAPAAEGNSDEN